MAKRKNSTALFEVMRAAQQKALERHGVTMQGQQNSAAPAASPASGSPASPAPAILQPAPAAAVVPPAPMPTGRSYAPQAGQSQLKPLGTPAIVTVARKWFSALTEKKPGTADVAAEAAPALDPHDPTAGMTAHSLAMRGARPAPKSAEPNPEAAFVDASDDDEIQTPVIAASKTAAQPPSSNSRPNVDASANANKVAIDRDRQEVTVKVRFQTVAIGVVATLVVVGLAYIAGKKTGAPTTRTATTPEIKEGPVQPGVLDPRGAKPGDASLAGSRIPGTPSANISPALNGSTTLRAGDAPFIDSPVVNGLAKREAGLNYCVIESYGPSQQQWALDVRDFLNSAGFPCTIEFGRADLKTRSGDYLIVGTRGFAPRYGNTAAYKSYIEGIEQASLSFPDKTKFRQPQMMMVKWANE